MFGSVNALFSGWAFVGVIIAILLQKEELELQRKELEETRKEFQQQNETLKRQRFENTFFSMVTLHNQIVNAIAVIKNSSGDISQGREAFEVIRRRMREFYDRNIRQPSKEKTSQVVADIFDNQYKNILGHYFRNLYRIYVFIDNSDVEDKEFYAKILRAQLSNYELVILFYNCYFYEAGENFQKYVKKYNLFDNFPLRELIHADDGEFLKSTKS